MTSQEESAVSIFDINLGTRAIALLMILFAATVISVPAAQAQTFAVLHTFTGYGDGGEPIAGLTMDRAGTSMAQPRRAAQPGMGRYLN